MAAGRSARAARRSGRRTARKTAKRPAAKPAARPRGTGARPVKAAPAPPQQVLYRLCRPGWSVIVEKAANALGTRFVCPFCPKSHRVPGPVRGFRKVRHAQWVKLRRVGE